VKVGVFVGVKVAVLVGATVGVFVGVKVGVLLGATVGVGWFKSTREKSSKMCPLAADGA